MLQDSSDSWEQKLNGNLSKAHICHCHEQLTSVIFWMTHSLKPDIQASKLQLNGQVHGQEPESGSSKGRWENSSKQKEARLHMGI